MPVAPTPPTKPSLPVVPTVTLPNSNTAGDQHTPAPANQTQPPGKSVSPVVTGTAKELEGLGKAFQGNSTPHKAEAKAEPAAKETPTKSMIAPGRSFDSQAGTSTQTVPAQPPVPDSKPSGFSYVPFVVIVGAIAVILLGLRLFKRKKEQQRTIVDYSQRSTAVIGQDGLDIVVSPQTPAPKVKQNFELRI
ncbi:MAG: hypothetical protein K0R22_831 [Sporomusa sp.]|nr:hypothetical protein [Sporomusa sp.]